MVKMLQINKQMLIFPNLVDGESLSHDSLQSEKGSWEKAKLG
jgi:hypothetical protein